MLIIIYLFGMHLCFIAPQASLDGMPDNILLLIMKNLGNRLKSLIVLSRVCRRFYILHLDESVWSDVELTKESIGTKLESRQLKKIINNYLPRTLWRIKLASNAHSHSARNPTVTASIVNDLFTKCPNVKSVILENCDVSLVSALYVLALQRASFLAMFPGHHSLD